MWFSGKLFLFSNDTKIDGIGWAVSVVAGLENSNVFSRLSSFDTFYLCFGSLILITLHFLHWKWSMTLDIDKSENSPRNAHLNWELYIFPKQIGIMVVYFSHGTHVDWWFCLTLWICFCFSAIWPDNERNGSDGCCYWCCVFQLYSPETISIVKVMI